MKYLLYAACALVLIGLAALLPAAAAPPTGGIDVEKYVSVDGGLTWFDADAAPGPILLSTGPAPRFRFNVTNLGGSALTGVALTDDVLGAITVPGNLVGGASVEVIVTGAWAAGQHTNVATVTATKGGESFTDSDAAHYFGVAAAQPPVAAFSGVPTSGTAPLAVTFTDASTGAPTSWAWDFENDGTVDSSLQNPAHTYAAPGTYTVNLTVTNAGGSDSEVKADYITVSAPPVPPVAAFSAVPTSGDAPLAVTFTDESTGGVITAWSWTFGDGGTSAEQNPIHSYAAPGTYTVSLTVTNADGSDDEVKAGYITVAVPPNPSISIEVRTNGEDADTPPGPSITVGSPVLWTYVVTNTGNVALTDVAVTDDQGVVVSAPKTVLEPDESMTATASGMAVPGQYANVGTVTASPPTGPAVTDSDPSHYLGIGSPAIDFEMYVSPDGGATWIDADAPPGPDVLAGTDPVFKFVTTNTGDVPLSMVSAYGHLGPIAQLAPGESFEATEVGTWEAGQRLLGAQASGSWNGQTVMDQDGAWYFGVSPGIHLEVLTNGEDADTPPGPSITIGSPVLWSYIVTNTGNVALSNVAVTDDRGVTVTAPKTVLAPGESMTATASGTAVAGQYANVGTVTASPAGGQTVTASDPSHYFGLSPLVAAFSASPASGDAPLAVTFTDESTGAPASWAWDFENDGTVDATTPNPTFTYAAAGTYDVNLTVTGPGGTDSEVKTGYITVTDPTPALTASFTAAPNPVEVDQPVTFTPTVAGGTAPYAYLWGFGDSETSTDASPTHTYTGPGLYTVTLTVTDGSQGTVTATPVNVVVTAAPVPPVAAFSASPTSGLAPLAVQFTDASTGDGTTSWFWDFGDGGTSTERNPLHPYATSGLFTVTLTVTNAAGSDSETKTDYIQIGTPIPAVRFGANVTDGTAPLAVRFTDSSNLLGQNLTSRLWEFGDGQTSTEADPVHVYVSAGTYTVNLTVANDVGPARLSKPGYVTVTAPPITGADRAYFLVSTVPAGAEIYLEGIDGTRYLQGNTTAGPLNVTLCLTCSPVRKVVASRFGYRDATWEIAAYPAKGETVPVALTLEPVTTWPFPGPHIPWTVIQAEDYDLGGEGVAYHDVEPANLGGRYRNEGVDIETEAGVTNVGWIRAGEYLKYTVDTTIGGEFYLTLRASNPDAATKPVTVYVDGVPAGQVMVGRTGAWTSFADFTGAAPIRMPAGRHVVTLSFEGISRINIDWLRLAAGTVPTVTTTVPATTPAADGASFTATPVTAPRGAAVKFVLTPAAGKTVKAAWWSFDAPAHLRTWNSRNVNPTFFYPRTGTFSPLVRITYTDNTVEEVHRLNYIRAT